MRAGGGGERGRRGLELHAAWAVHGMGGRDKKGRVERDEIRGREEGGGGLGGGMGQKSQAPASALHQHQEA